MRSTYARLDPLRPRGDEIAHRHGARLDAPEISAQVPARAEARARHELHGEAQLRHGLAALGCFEDFEQRGSRVPIEARAAMHDHVALERRERDQAHVAKPEALGDCGEVGRDLLEHRAIPADLVHLVDGDHDVGDREEGGHRRMASRLLGDATRRVHEDHRKVGGAGAGHHVARVLHVSGRVGDDEAAARRREVAVGDVHRDALLALDREPVGEEREVERGAAAALAGALHRRELVLEESLGIQQQSPDERALAVVHRSGGRESQGRRHQKYPSRLRSSIDASEVWSSMRVAPRSVSVAAAVSAITSSTSAASEATGHVQVMSPTVRKRTRRTTETHPRAEA
jgi:hypothetical protein